MKLSAILEPLLAANADPVLILTLVRAYEDEQETGKEKARARWRKYNDRLALSASNWAFLRAAVLERDDFTCVYCGSNGSVLSPLHVDHVIPLSRGGTNDPANLAAACMECNCGKAGKTLEEWLR